MNKDNIKIRTANESDIENLNNLYKELDKDAINFQPEHFVMSIREDEYYLQILENENSDFLVLEDDDKMLGFALVTMVQSKKLSCLKQQRFVYIGDLVITETKRSNGFGTILMDSCKKYGKERGAEFIRTQVFPGNAEGMRYYEKNNFKETMKTIEACC